MRAFRSAAVAAAAEAAAAACLRVEHRRARSPLCRGEVNPADTLRFRTIFVYRSSNTLHMLRYLAWSSYALG